MTAVPAATHLRAVMIGLLGFAAVQEQQLLASHREPESGSTTRWAAAPLVAHSTEFKQQQVQRIESIVHDSTPPDFAEIDHNSAALYAAYAAQSPDLVAAESWAATGALISGVAAIDDEELLDPGRRPWLRGRLLWLQVIVRGFWHPCGHLGDYYLAHGQVRAAIQLAARGVETAGDLDAPDPVRGMAYYNLACAQAQAGRYDDAEVAIADAIAHNPDLRTNAGRDPDLAPLREGGRIAALLGH
jgi:hypothetical protein